MIGMFQLFVFVYNKITNEVFVTLKGINMITETSLGGGDNSKDIITSIEKPPPVPPQSSSKIQHQQQQTTTQRTSPTPRTNLARTSSNAANSSHKPNNTSSNNNVLPWIPISGETIINREESIYPSFLPLLTLFEINRWLWYYYSKTNPSIRR